MVTGSARDRRCPGCGAEVGERARDCPRCGAPLDRESGLATVVVLVVAAVMAGAAIIAMRGQPDAENRRPPQTQAAVVLTEALTQTPTLESTPSSTSTPIAGEGEPAATDTSTPDLPTATPVPTGTPTASPSPSPTPVPTETPTAVPTAVPTATEVPTSTPRVHVVRSGDTLSTIASQYGTTVAAILEANPGLTQYSMLSIGQEIALPFEGEAAAPSETAGSGNTVVYTIRGGDTLLGVALQYDLTVDDILAVNPGMTEGTMLRVGQEILVPVP